MLKIDDSVSRRHIPNHITSQLSPVHVTEVKTWIYIFTFLMIDGLCIVPVISDRFALGYFLAVIIPTVLLTIWGITLLCRNFYSTQVETLYFIAANGIIGAFCYFIVSQKLVYVDFQAESKAYFIISCLFYLGWIAYFTQYIFKKYANFKWRHGLKNYPLEFLRILLFLLPSNGYNFYHFYVKNNPFEEFIMSVIYLSLGTLFLYIGVLYVHRILFIYTNPTHFRLYEPSRKEIKQAEAKGRKIKVG